MRVYTVEGTQVRSGARVSQHTLTNGTKVPAIVVGEEGRGRSRGVLPIIGGQTVEDAISFCTVEARSNNRYVIIDTIDTNDNTAVVLVLRPVLGFRGSCGWEGDLAGWCCTAIFEESRPLDDAGRRAVERLSEICTRVQLDPTASIDAAKYRRACGASGPGARPGTCPECGNNTTVRNTLPNVIPTLVEGIVADGAAGRMASGAHGVVLLPVNTVLRVWSSGRRSPEAIYLRWTGSQLLHGTLSEREMGLVDIPLPRAPLPVQDPGWIVRLKPGVNVYEHFELLESE